jgi:hypothetical protein
MEHRERRDKINAAVEEANAAFWEVIQSHFPEVKSSLNTYMKHHFNQEQTSAVTHWYFQKNKQHEHLQ